MICEFSSARCTCTCTCLRVCMCIYMNMCTCTCMCLQDTATSVARLWLEKKLGAWLWEKCFILLALAALIVVSCTHVYTCVHVHVCIHVYFQMRKSRPCMKLSCVIYNFMNLLILWEDCMWCTCTLYMFCDYSVHI